MRKIEFRGKNYNGNWVYGDLLINGQDYKNAIRINNQTTSHDEVWRVKENTVCQYTGIDDKDGTPIFENDIVRTKYKEKRSYQGVPYDYYMEFNELVVFKSGQFMLEINNCGIKMYCPLVDFFKINDIEQVELEVIGNKFDNYELLEQM